MPAQVPNQQPKLWQTDKRQEYCILYRQQRVHGIDEMIIGRGISDTLTQKNYAVKLNIIQIRGENLARCHAAHVW